MQASEARERAQKEAAIAKFGILSNTCDQIRAQHHRLLLKDDDLMKKLALNRAGRDSADSAASPFTPQRRHEAYPTPSSTSSSDRSSWGTPKTPETPPKEQRWRVAGGWRDDNKENIPPLASGNTPASSPWNSSPMRSPGVRGQQRQPQQQPQQQQQQQRLRFSPIRFGGPQY